jgi:hypothetical protein
MRIYIIGNDGITLCRERPTLSFIASAAERSPAQQKEVTRHHAEGATLAELARSYHVGKSTISRL